jgi:sugar lactone lactonase YvrE
MVSGCGGGGGEASSTAYTIGVGVTGLKGTVVLQNNGGSNLTVSIDGTYTFSDQYASGASYDVTVLTQPAGQGCVVTNATGTVAAAPVTAPTVTCQDPGLALFAGNASGAGSADGAGRAASFQTPTGVATDSAGNLYVADFNNGTIRKITPGGIVTTLAGPAEVMGSANGTGAAAGFRGPYSVATDIAGNVYVADSGNNTIRKITPTGVATTLAGTAGMAGSADGTGAAARFANPSGVATDIAGNVYVADSGNNTIRKITSNGEVTTLAGTPGVKGSADGTGAAARFDSLYGIATDSMGNVYAADYSNGVDLADLYGGTIRKITPAGVVTTFAGTAGVKGSADGTGAAARFYGPAGIATDSANNVYVTEQVNNTIRKITPAAVGTSGGFSKAAWHERQRVGKGTQRTRAKDQRCGS